MKVLSKKDFKNWRYFTNLAQIAKLATFVIYRRYDNFFFGEHLCMISINSYKLSGGSMGGFKFQKAPPIPPKKVRKLCCFDCLNGKSPRNLPIRPEIALTCRKYQLLTHLLNFHYVLTKWDLMSPHTPLELKFRHKLSILEV